MKKSTLSILIICCILAGAAGWYVKNRQATSWQQNEAKIGEKVFPRFPINEISKITINSINDQVDLVKANNRWVVSSQDNYPADFAKIGNLLKDLHGLTPAQSVQVGEGDYDRLNLAPSSASTGTGTDLIFYGTGGDDVAELRLGKEHKREVAAQPASPWGGGNFPNGRYILVPKDGNVYVVTETFSSVTDNANDWIDKTFIRAGKAKRVVGSAGDDTLWTLKRETEAGSLFLEPPVPEGYEPNSSKITSVGSALSYPSFQRVAPIEEAADFGFDDRNRQFMMETFDGFTYTLQLGEKTAQGDVPAKVAIAYSAPPAPTETDEEAVSTHQEKVSENQEKAEQQAALFKDWIYFLPSHIADNLLVSADDLMKEKEPEEGEEEAPVAPAPAPAPVPAPPPPPVVEEPAPAPETEKTEAPPEPEPAPAPKKDDMKEGVEIQ